MVWCTTQLTITLRTKTGAMTETFARKTRKRGTKSDMTRKPLRGKSALPNRTESTRWSWTKSRTRESRSNLDVDLTFWLTANSRPAWPKHWITPILWRKRQVLGNGCHLEQQTKLLKQTKVSLRLQTTPTSNSHQQISKVDLADWTLILRVKLPKCRSKSLNQGTQMSKYHLRITVLRSQHHAFHLHTIVRKRMYHHHITVQSHQFHLHTTVRSQISHLRTRVGNQEYHPKLQVNYRHHNLIQARDLVLTPHQARLLSALSILQQARQEQFAQQDSRRSELPLFQASPKRVQPDYFASNVFVNTY